MRTFRTIFVALSALLWTGMFVPAVMISTAPDAAIAAPEGAPAAPAVPDINVTVDGGGEKRVVWFANPLIIAVAGVGLLVAIAVVVMAARGGGTTIIREK